MQTKNKPSTNYPILKEILSKSRSANLPNETRYLFIYAFIYKYCSDSLKDHFLLRAEDMELTLDEAYKIRPVYEDLKNDAFHMYGYFIEKSDVFIDDVVNNKFDEKTFLRQFFESFSENVEFPKNSNEGTYFNFIFNAVKDEFPFELYESDSESTRIIKDIIKLISKLDIFDSEFPFSDVFDAAGSSRLLKINSNPEYIYQILSAILVSLKPDLENVYDPFMRDGLSFLGVSDLIGPWKSKNYGKESDKAICCYTIARLFIGYYNLNSLFIQNEDAFESIDINNVSFDGILSVIPIAIHNYHTSNKNQSLEIARRHKREKLEKVLYNDFNMDLNSFSEDSELNGVLEKLINKMDVDIESDQEFGGEYEPLNDSEFLFLINLIDSLKNDGVMAISISHNFLFKDSLRLLRKYLIFEKNYVDAIINIPNEIGRYKQPEVVIIFRKNRNVDDVLFIDMSRDYETKKGRLMVPGLFKRNLLLKNSNIEKMVDTLTNRLVIGKYSNLVDMNEIIRNDFNLSVSKYVDTFEGKFIDLRDLVKQKKEIDERRDDLTCKIDKMMGELNIRF